MSTDVSIFVDAIKVLTNSESVQSADKDELSFLDNSDLAIADFEEALSYASELEKGVRFEGFNPTHMRYASSLINVLFKITLPNLVQTIQYMKNFINEYLFNYVVCVVLRHRADASQLNIQLPSHICTQPEMYIDMTKVNGAVQSESASTTADSTPATGTLEDPIDVGLGTSASDLDPEHRVAYFREDIGISLHHRHWHEVYPSAATEGDAKAVVDKDRRGEFFYYMHQQILARYNFERLCNKLTQVKPFYDFHEPIMEAYYPKLDPQSIVKPWSSRQPGTILKDFFRDGNAITLTQMERWRDRLYNAAESGLVLAIDKEDGTVYQKPLDAKDGINDLGNMLEAAESLSVNYSYYGNFHTNGHLFITFCHDPDHRYQELGSVMGQFETALRDPMFYRWHALLDDIFNQHKNTLSPYTKEEKGFSGIEIEDLYVIEDTDSDSSADGSSNEPSQNRLTTFMKNDTVDISEGILNRKPEDGPLYVKFVHLDHKEFTYNIKVNNTSGEEKIGTVRIFYAPASGASHSKNTTFNVHRRFFIELDKFTYKLSNGVNTITRKSTSSSVTIPFQQIFLGAKEAQNYCQNEVTKAALSYCGCGWPHYFLIGKGDAAGLDAKLFVMITDYEQDKVEGSGLESDDNCCIKSAVSYCGIRDKKYPDARAMGFPFDRNIKDIKGTLNDFMTEKNEKTSKSLTNMKSIDIKIYHNTEIL